MTNYVTAAGVQNWSITIASGSATGTVTLGTSVGAGAFINYGGSNPQATTDFANAGAYLTFDGVSVITAHRNTSTTNTVVVTGSITDGDTTNLVKAVQYGTVTITAGTTAGATVTAPSADGNAAIHHLGNSGTGTTLAADIDYGVLTQSGATVTATYPATGTTTTGFCLTEFIAACMTANAVQRISATSSGSVPLWTASLAHNVVLAHALSLWGGKSIATITTADNSSMMYGVLSAVGTFTAHVNTGAADAKTFNASIVEFNSGVLNSAVQRGTTTLPGVVTGSTLLASINETYAGVSWLGNSTTAGTAQLGESTGAAKLGTQNINGYLQIVGGTSQTNTLSSITINLNVPTTAGSTIIIAYGSDGGTSSVPLLSVSDSASQSYTSAEAENYTSGTANYNAAVFYFQNTVAGVTSVTLNWTEGVNTMFAAVYEVPCPTSGNIIDAINTSSNSASPTGDITTSADYDFIVIAYANPTASVTSPYTADGINNCSAWYYPSSTVTNSQATISGIKASASVAFLTNQVAPYTEDVVTVTKATATATITGSWEVFEFPAYVAPPVSANSNAIWFGAIA